MRFEFQAAEKLWDGGVEHKRIEQIDVIDQKKTSTMGIEARRASHDKPAPASFMVTRQSRRCAPSFLRGSMKIASRIIKLHNGKKNAAESNQWYVLRAIAQARRKSPLAGSLSLAGAELTLAVRFRRSYHHVQRAGQHLQRSTSRVKYFAIHDHIHGFPNPNSIRFAVRREARRCRMCEPSTTFCMIPHQADRARWVPNAHIQLCRCRSTACGAIIILPPVYLLLLKATNRHRRVVALAIGPQGKRAAAQARERNQHTHQITELSQKFQVAIGQRGDVRCEPHVQRIDVKKRLAARVVQANHVTGTPAAVENCFDGEFRQFRSRRNKSRRKELPVPRGRKPNAARPAWPPAGKSPLTVSKPGAIAAHGDEVAISGSVAFVRKHCGFTGGVCLAYFQVEARFAKPVRAGSEPASHNLRRPRLDSRL